MEPKVDSQTHGGDILTEKKESNQPMSEGACAMSGEDKKPTCVIVLGMAGSGKTTFVQVKQFKIVQV